MESTTIGTISGTLFLVAFLSFFFILELQELDMFIKRELFLKPRSLKKVYSYVPTTGSFSETIGVLIPLS